eukprot:scaffold46026_cov47-Phaeocystis_antarctica.AAC.6
MSARLWVGKGASESGRLWRRVRSAEALSLGVRRATQAKGPAPQAARSASRGTGATANSQRASPRLKPMMSTRPHDVACSSFTCRWERWVTASQCNWLSSPLSLYESKRE